MGDRRRRSTPEVDTTHTGSWPVELRMAGSWSVSGALVCLVLADGCVPDAVAPADVLLRIGVAESAAASSEFGMGQLTRLLTLERLTQLTGDGRAAPRLAETWTIENGKNLRLRL